MQAASSDGNREDSSEATDAFLAFREGRWEDAVQDLGQALQSRIEASGGEADECADLYYHYGAALFYRAQEESDVFGAPIENTVASTNPSNLAGPSNLASSSGNEEEASKIEEGDEAGEGEEEEGEDADDDMQLAWENLEVAKSIYERNTEANKSKLADVHTLLADLAMEQENFESALSDYNSAFEFTKTSACEEEGSDRRLAELHFKIGLTLQFLQKPEDALKEVEAAIIICTKCLSSHDTAKTEDDTTLKSVLDDLRAKEEELKQAVEEMKKQKETIQAAFQKAFGPSLGGNKEGGRGEEGGTSKVVDLGTVGQGRRRINLAPVQNTANGANAQNSGHLEKKPKRTLEELMGGNLGNGLSSKTQKTDLTTDPQKRECVKPKSSLWAEEQKALGKENMIEEPQFPATLPSKEIDK